MIKELHAPDETAPLSGLSPGLPSPEPLRAPATGAGLLAKRQKGWELGLPVYFEPKGRQAPVIIAVGGGKGGVGKSLVSANLAVRLAAAGKRVLAIDLDIGGANLHTYFGVNAPRFALADAIIFKSRTLSEISQQTSVDGVKLVAGGREEAWGGPGGLDQSALKALFEALFSLKAQGEVDIVILDLGAGTHKHTVDFFTAAHFGLVTVLPEPTSIENAYLFLKTMLFRVIEHVGHWSDQRAVANEIRSLLLAPDQPGIRSAGYAEKLRAAALKYPAFISQLGLALGGRTVGITVNQVRCQKDIDVGKSMEVIGERYFGFQSRFCGYLNYDEAAWKSLRNRRLLVIDFPHSVLSRRFSDLARQVLLNLGL